MRVRFAPSPTGYLHIGSARTFIFNWLYARHNGGTMILRIDDTDVERNTQQSLDSIFDGLRWLDLGWDEEYRQSDRGELHRRMAEAIFDSGLAYRDFTPAAASDEDAKPRGRGLAVQPRHARAVARRERPARRRRRAVRPALPRAARSGADRQLRRRRLRRAVEVHRRHRRLRAAALATACRPITWPPAPTTPTCSITHIIRGQDHLTNTFKHVLIFEALGVASPRVRAPAAADRADGAKLSKRKHGPVVSVTTYRDAGFLPHAFVNFLCLLGWSPKDDRE